MYEVSAAQIPYIHIQKFKCQMQMRNEFFEALSIQIIHPLMLNKWTNKKVRVKLKKMEKENGNGHLNINMRTLRISEAISIWQSIRLWIWCVNNLAVIFCSAILVHFKFSSEKSEDKQPAVAAAAAAAGCSTSCVARQTEYCDKCFIVISTFHFVRSSFCIVVPHVVLARVQLLSLLFINNFHAQST